MSMSFPAANSEIPISELIALNDALRKAADVGYQTPAVTAGGDAGTFAPLVPQSIEPSLASATFSMEEVVLWKRIAKRSITQTVHEYARVQEHGADLDPFFAEGSVPATNRTEYSRQSVRVKYLAERREITDVASMVGLIGPNPSAIAEETERGTTRLLSRLERAIFHADSSVNSLAFDGLFRQIESAAPNNVFNLEGSAVTPALLQQALGELSAAPRYGRPDAIYVEPRVHAELIQQATAHGRHDQLTISESSGITYGAKQISIMGPYGAVPVVAAPFLHNKWGIDPARGSLGDTIPTTPTLSVAIAAAPNAASKFVAADAGDYIYVVEAVGTKGASALLTTAAVTVAAGDRVTFTIQGAPAIVPIYYRIFRSTKDGAATTAKLVKEVVYNGAGTAITDDNDIKPGTSKILICSHRPDEIQFVKLLDYMRRPLAEVETTKPFLLMLFGAPIVKVPTKQFVLQNVGVNDAGLGLTY